MSSIAIARPGRKWADPGRRQASSSGSGVTSHKETISGAEGESVTIEHSLGTLDVLVQVLDLETSSPAFPAIEFVDSNNIRLTFDQQPADNTYRVLLLAI